MSRLLCIQASPRGNISMSIAVTDAFVEAYRQAHQADEIVTVDLFKKDLPSFDGLAVQAKYAIFHGLEHTEEELAVWRDIEAVIEEFTSADKYVLAVPMWNFSIPYRLKQYIDIIVQPTYTFSYSPDSGYEGLVKGKPIFVAYARGGDYSAADYRAFDLQTTYLETILHFIGFEHVRSVVLEPTLQGGPDAAWQKLGAAVAKAREIAREF